MDDPNVDGLICAAPNHWHAAATVAACAAGKNVYVEKPASHTAEEGEMMIAAARKSGKAVQVNAHPFFDLQINGDAGGDFNVDSHSPERLLHVCGQLQTAGVAGT